LTSSGGETTNKRREKLKEPRRRNSTKSTKDYFQMNRKLEMASHLIGEQLGRAMGKGLV